MGKNSNNRLFFAFLSITVVIFMVRLYSCIIWENETKFLEVLQNCSPKGPSSCPAGACKNAFPASDTFSSLDITVSLILVIRRAENLQGCELHSPGTGEAARLCTC